MVLHHIKKIWRFLDQIWKRNKVFNSKTFYFLNFPPCVIVHWPQSMNWSFSWLDSIHGRRWRRIADYCIRFYSELISTPHAYQHQHHCSARTADFDIQQFWIQTKVCLILLASQDAQEVMWVSEWVSEWVLVSRLDWCDWWYVCHPWLLK